MSKTNRIFVTGAFAALLVGTASAQLGLPSFRFQPSVQRELVPGASARLGRGGPGGFARAGFRGGWGAGAALGTEITVGLYDQEPVDGIEPIETLTFTVGEDSEVAFAEALAAARANATWMVVETSEQTRAIDLPDADNAEDAVPLATPGLELGFALHGLARGPWQNGDTVTAVFFDGDPDAGGSELQTLAFTYGGDSAAGFQAEFAEAAQDAEWVVVTTPPRTQTIDLSEAGEAADGFANPANFQRPRPISGFSRR